MSKTHPMDAFGSFLHNPLADEFLSDQMNVVKFIMMQKIEHEYDIYTVLEELLVDFKENNRVELETKGLVWFLNKLKDKVIENPSNIGPIIYCLNMPDVEMTSQGEPKILGEKPGGRQFLDISNPKDKILTKYTNKNREEITITVKSICRALIKDVFKYNTEEGKKETDELCVKMIKSAF